MDNQKDKRVKLPFEGQGRPLPTPNTYNATRFDRLSSESDQLGQYMVNQRRTSETRQPQTSELNYFEFQKLQARNETLEKDIELLRAENKQLLDKNTYLQQQLAQFQQVYQSQYETSYYSQTQPQIVETPQVSKTPEPQSVISSNPSDSFVHTYNTNPNSISRYTTGVSETQESIARRAANSSDRRVRLRFIGASFFWVITSECGISYLVPRPGIDPLANAVSFDTFQCVFEVTGTIQVGRKLQLVHPAEVEQHGDEWEVIKTGEVYFS